MGISTFLTSGVKVTKVFDFGVASKGNGVEPGFILGTKK